MQNHLTIVKPNSQGRCTEHPAFDADYCPRCGTAQTIGANGATRVQA